MIDDLDEALRRLLVRELPIKSGEVDIAFDQPKRDWSARLSRPALNLFLFDIRENQKLRQAQRMWQAEHQDGQGVTQRRQAVRLDLRYFITAWATEPEDEHRLLARTLAALFLYPTLPDDLLPEGLLGQPAPIQLLVAQEANLAAPSDLWGVMDNELRPAIVCVVTMGLNPYQRVHTPLVRTRELRVGPSDRPSEQVLSPQAQPDSSWTIGGQLRSASSMTGVRLTLIERGLDVALQSGGRFTAGPLPAGQYTLAASIEGSELRRYRITVPAADYELDL